MNLAGQAATRPSECPAPLFGLRRRCGGPARSWSRPTPASRCLRLRQPGPAPLGASARTYRPWPTCGNGCAAWPRDRTARAHRARQPGGLATGIGSPWRNAPPVLISPGGLATGQGGVSFRAPALSSSALGSLIAPCRGRYVGHASKPSQDMASVSVAFPMDANSHRPEIGVQAIQLSPYHAGPSAHRPWQLSPVADSLACSGPHHLSDPGEPSGPGISLQFLRLSRGYNKAPRGAHAPFDSVALLVRLGVESRWAAASAAASQPVAHRDHLRDAVLAQVPTEREGGVRPIRQDHPAGTRGRAAGPGARYGKPQACGSGNVSTRRGPV